MVMRVRSHLLMVASVVLLPGFIAAAIAIDGVRRGEREAALMALRETVRATELLVDGQVQRALGALTVLANSPSLQAGDFEAFYREAAAADLPPDVWTLLLDESGLQRLNTIVPFGTPPPPPEAAQRVATVLSTQRPLVTDVIVGPVTKRLLTIIYVPARPSPHGRFVVAQAFAVDHWKKTALKPEAHPDWIVAVIDRQGRFISRSHLTEELVGQPARPELVAAAAASNDGLIRHSTLEGIDAYDAFSRSSLTGWTIAVAAPVPTIEASAAASVAWLAAGAGLALLAALAGASLLNRRVTRAMEHATEAAQTLGAGREPPALRTSLLEVNALGDALTGAGRALAHERQARMAVESHREELLERERAARTAAQSENAAKDQFLALLGHELRNPLAAISGAATLLARQRLPGDDASRRMVDILQRQSGHLKHIVDDLLDVSRMLMGKIELDTHPLDLARCVNHCVEAMRASGRDQMHRLVAHTEEAWVNADPVRLEQIVNNLLWNSIKFSPAGSEVRIEVAAAGAHAVVRVVDHGDGIAADLLPRIFDPFVQGAPGANQLASGLGIGLALVRQLVRLHGGEIPAHSDGAGRGATFVIELPRVAAHNAPEPETAQPPFEPCRVLLVDDNLDARDTTAALLRGLGCHVDVAGDGAQAIERAASGYGVDVVVMDLGLPGMTGLEVAVALRALPALAHLRLIALSGYGQPRDVAAALAAGFDAHLTKPATPETLAQAITRVRHRD